MAPVIKTGWKKAISLLTRRKKKGVGGEMRGRIALAADMRDNKTRVEDKLPQISPLAVNTE